MAESLLQPSEYDFVGCFDLTIGLWVLDGSEVVLDLVAGEETSKFLIDELGSVVCYHRIRYSESGEDIPLYELPNLCSGDGGKRL